MTEWRFGRPGKRNTGAFDKKRIFHFICRRHFDTTTEQAVREFQTSLRLGTSGIVDKLTYNFLKASSNTATQQNLSKAQPAERPAGTYTLTANLWVRNKPSMAGNQIGTRDVLETVEVEGFENGWARIKFDVSPAYVAGNYLRHRVRTCQCLFLL